MKSGGNTQGFTIVETLIYLAVSTAIMASVLTLVGGSQNKAQFQQAVNDTNQQINDIINNVSNGYYNNTGNITCDGTPSGPFISPVSSELGTNKNCIFLGRVIQFGVDGDGNKMNIYDAVGLRETGGKQVTSLSESQLKLIAPGTLTTSSFPDASDKRQLKDGFTVEDMYYGGLPANQISGIAVLSDFAQTNDSSTILKSGSQSLSVYAIKNTSRGQNLTQFVDTANNSSYYEKSSEGIFICFDSATVNKHTEINIGGVARGLNTTMEVKDGKCA